MNYVTNRQRESRISLIATIKLNKSLGKSQHASEVYTPNRLQGVMGTLRNAAASPESIPIRTGDWTDKLGYAKGQVYTKQLSGLVQLCTFHQPKARAQRKRLLLSMVLKKDAMESSFAKTAAYSWKTFPSPHKIITKQSFRGKTGLDQTLFPPLRWQY